MAKNKLLEMKNWKDIESKLDTERFGFKVGKIDGEFFKTHKIQILDILAKEDFKLIISRVDMNDVDLINDLERLGFRYKDSQITYKYDLNQFKSSVPHISFKYEIRDFKESDIDILVKLAGDSFDGYGHYFANKQLDPIKCREVYEDWAYNTCTNSNVADKIIVAHDNDKPIGYLSFKIYESDGKKYAAGGMGAVDKNYRGNNIFPAIISAGLQWGKDIELDWEEHNVIVNNFPVNRSMNKLGFKPNNPVITMHKWLK